MRKLCAAVMSRLSERHAALPRRRKRSILRLNLVSANIASIMLERRREHGVRRLLDAGGSQLAAGGVDKRPELPKSADELVSSAAITIWRSVLTAWALYPCAQHRSRPGDGSSWSNRQRGAYALGVPRRGPGPDEGWLRFAARQVFLGGLPLPGNDLLPAHGSLRWPAVAFYASVAPRRSRCRGARRSAVIRIPTGAPRPL